MELNDIAINVEKVENGGWVGDIPNMGDLRLKVRGLNNTAYRRLQERLIAAVPRAKRQGGRIDPKELERITAQCLLDTVLLDWDGVKINGQPAPYAKDLARELLTEPKWAAFRDAVAYAAAVVAHEDEAALEADTGN